MCRILSKHYPGHPKNRIVIIGPGPRFPRSISIDGPGGEQEDSKNIVVILGAGRYLPLFCDSNARAPKKPHGRLIGKHSLQHQILEK